MEKTVVDFETHIRLNEITVKHGTLRILKVKNKACPNEKKWEMEILCLICSELTSFEKGKKQSTAIANSEARKKKILLGAKLLVKILSESKSGKWDKIKQTKSIVETRIISPNSSQLFVLYFSGEKKTKQSQNNYGKPENAHWKLLGKERYDLFYDDNNCTKHERKILALAW